MVRKRAKTAGIHRDIGNHSFRATGITTYLNNGGTLEDARIMANHSNSTTTKLYDRTKDVAKVQEIQRLKF
jgi:integrase